MNTFDPATFFHDSKRIFVGIKHPSTDGIELGIVTEVNNVKFEAEAVVVYRDGLPAKGMRIVRDGHGRLLVTMPLWWFPRHRDSGTEWSTVVIVSAVRFGGSAVYQLMEIFGIQNFPLITDANRSMIRVVQAQHPDRASVRRWEGSYGEGYILIDRQQGHQGFWSRWSNKREEQHP